METPYSKYKGYFDRRIVSESNPGGQFIVFKRTNYTLEQSKEFGIMEQKKNAMENTKEKVTKTRNKVKDN